METKSDHHHHHHHLQHFLGSASACEQSVPSVRRAHAGIGTVFGLAAASLVVSILLVGLAGALAASHLSPETAWRLASGRVFPETDLGAQRLLTGVGVGTRQTVTDKQDKTRWVDRSKAISREKV